MSAPQRLHPRTAHLSRMPTPAKMKMVQEAKNMQVVVQEKAARRGLRMPPFEFLELIGKGSFGRVFKSRDLKSNMVVAIKIVDADKADSDFMAANDSLADFLKEVRTLKALKESRAKNINLIFDAFAYDTGFWIVSQYCPGGSVHTLMKCSPSPGLDERYSIPIARELSEAISWVHESGIIHRDVKAANVLVSEDGSVQLCDFGVSAMLEHKVDKRSTVLGTPWWMAPELAIASHSYLNVSYGKEVDVWAFGCTIFEMATGFPPNCRVQPERLGQALLERVPRLEPGMGHSERLQSMVAFCLEERPAMRPTIEMVRGHEWLRESESQFPTSNLKELVRKFYVWEQAGGQRQSLLMPGGAPGADLPSDAPPNDDGWNFSTSETWDDKFHGEDHDVSALNDSAGFSLPIASLGNSAQATPATSEDEQLGGYAGHRARRAKGGPKHPLERMFDKDDPTNYAERHKNFLPPLPPALPSGPPQSDLPLRNQGPQQSSVRDTTIDLGDWDPSSGNIHIPDFKTIRESKGRYSRKLSSADEEDDSSYQYGSEVEDDYRKRVTRDWKFPAMAITDDEAEEDNVPTARPRTRDWKFPLVHDDGEQSQEDSLPMRPRPKTQDWKFPVMTSDDDYSHEDSEDPETAKLPNLAPASAFRPRLIHQETAPIPAGYHAFGGYHETASAPVSPPESMIDLDEAERIRPSTSNGPHPEEEYEAYQSSDYAASDHTGAFSLEHHLDQQQSSTLSPAEEQGLATVRPGSTSSHRQSRSVPPFLESSSSNSNPVISIEAQNEDELNDLIHRRQGSLDTSNRADRDRQARQSQRAEEARSLFNAQQRELWRSSQLTSNILPQSETTLPPRPVIYSRKMPNTHRLEQLLGQPWPDWHSIVAQIDDESDDNSSSATPRVTPPNFESTQAVLDYEVGDIPRMVASTNTMSSEHLMDGIPTDEPFPRNTTEPLTELATRRLPLPPNVAVMLPYPSISRNTSSASISSIGSNGSTVTNGVSKASISRQEQHEQAHMHNLTTEFDRVFVDSMREMEGFMTGAKWTAGERIKRIIMQERMEKERERIREAQARKASRAAAAAAATQAKGP